jgi:hypothetical protein
MNTQSSWESWPHRAKAAATAKVQVLFDFETGRVIASRPWAPAFGRDWTGLTTGFVAPS